MGRQDSAANRLKVYVRLIAVVLISFSAAVISEFFALPATAYADLSKASVVSAARDLSVDDLYQKRSEYFIVCDGDGDDWGSDKCIYEYDDFYAQEDGWANFDSLSPRGSYAYAYSFGRIVHRVTKPEDGSSYVWDASKVRTGDILKTDADHWVVVVKRDGSRLWTAEGDYNGKVREGWGKYVISGKGLVNKATNAKVAVTAAYHYKSAGSIFDSFMPFTSPDLKFKTPAGKVESLCGTFAGKKRVVVMSVGLDCGFSREIIEESQKLSKLAKNKGIVFIMVDEEGDLQASDSSLADTSNYKQRVVDEELGNGLVDAVDDRGVKLRVPWELYLGGTTSPTTVRHYDYVGWPIVLFIDEGGRVVNVGMATHEYGVSDYEDYWNSLDKEYSEHRTRLEKLIDESFRTPITKATISKVSNRAYTGSAQKPVPIVKLNGKTLKKGSDYKVSYKNNTNVGTATVVVTGWGGYVGAKVATFKITQAANKATVAKTRVSRGFKANAKTRRLTAAKTIALPKVTARFGTAKWAVSKKDTKKVLSLKSGKVQIKKGAKRGVYTIKLKAKVAKTVNYKAASTKVVTVKVTVS